MYEREVWAGQITDSHAGTDTSLHFKTEHQRFLDEEAASILELVLPQDIVTKNVLPFLTLPSHTFEQF